MTDSVARHEMISRCHHTPSCYSNSCIRQVLWLAYRLVEHPPILEAPLTQQLQLCWLGTSQLLFLGAQIC